eukprot:scaffold11268_cov178-Skeletonema_dohrnii-CCMP3373.AAC.1
MLCSSVFKCSLTGVAAADEDAFNLIASIDYRSSIIDHRGFLSKRKIGAGGRAAAVTLFETLSTVCTAFSFLLSPKSEGACVLFGSVVGCRVLSNSKTNEQYSLPGEASHDSVNRVKDTATAYYHLYYNYLIIFTMVTMSQSQFVGKMFLRAKRYHDANPMEMKVNQKEEE